MSNATLCVIPMSDSIIRRVAMCIAAVVSANLVENYSNPSPKIPSDKSSSNEPASQAEPCGRASPR